MAGFDIRRIEDQDLRPLLQLCEQFHRESPEYSGHAFDRVTCLSNLMRTLESEDCAGWVGYHDGELVGALLVARHPTFFSPRTFTTDSGFYVAPAMRGSLLAARLVKAYLKWAEEIPDNTIRLDVSAGIDNVRAEAFLRGMGFHKIGSMMVYGRQQRT